MRLGLEPSRDALADAASHEELSRERDHVKQQRDDLQHERDELLRERTHLLEKIEEIQRELERYGEHGERTSKLMLYATNYAESVRESARRDAELVLRKARIKAEKTLGDLESERKRIERDLVRLQALTSETRKRLSAFTTAALQILNAEVESGHDKGRKPPLDDLRDALQQELSSTAESRHTSLSDDERPAR